MNTGNRTDRGDYVRKRSGGLLSRVKSVGIYVDRLDEDSNGGRPSEIGRRRTRPLRTPRRQKL